jgi:hypothetical protein
MTKKPAQTFLEKLRLRLEAYQQGGKQPPLVKTPQQGQEVETDAEAWTGPPLEIGDELLITYDIVEMFPNLSNALRRVVLIDEIAAKGDKAVSASAFGIQVKVDMQVARQMRAAYIHREEAWESQEAL